MASLLAGVALGLAACTATVDGAPAPDPAVTASPTGTNASDLLRSLDACTVLDQLLAGQGFQPGERKTVRNECVASKSEYGALAIALDPVQGLAELQAQEPRAMSTQVNGRSALQVGSPADGMCEVGLAVGEHARALVIASISRSDVRDQVCTAAQELAGRLEPLLPKP
ncbi:DUF3558 domain-containing protein [Amycolatopsis tucumanensis]|uniref:DUF3558 domain-containing protein n=1 Tax=Amycolatopsis tucumanensis TaxID=401106 RepID=UPI003D73738F